MNIEEIYSLFLNCNGICTDTRRIEEGMLFFALKGDNFDGNRYAREALNKGAAYAISDDTETSRLDDRMIYVEDSLQCLQDLAVIHRSKFNIPFIGITGSNGKTTTKELFVAVLQQKYKVAGNKGNLNNHIGVPLTLLAMKQDAEIAVIEMGANHRGEIKRLCEIAQPTHGIITNIGHAHLEGFGGFEGVVQAKSELYQHILKNNGHLFVNGDDALLIELSQDIRRTIYGGESQLRGKILTSTPSLKIEWEDYNSVLHSLETNLFGGYNLANAMAAICAGLFFLVNNEKINQAISSYHPDNNRSQFHDSGKNIIIKDAYNANPSSMLSAISDFKRMTADEKMLILGDMFELGDESNIEHIKLLEKIREFGFMDVILIGRDFIDADPNRHFQHFNSTNEAADYLATKNIKGKIVLVKGSRGMALEKLYELL